MNNQLKWVLGILGGAILIAALMIALRPEPDQVEPDEQAPLVQTVPLETASGAIPVSLSGTVQPRDEVVISAQVSGRLTYVDPSFREGQFVRANRVLLRIEPTDFENQVRIAQADVAAQEVAVLQAREEIDIARRDLERFSQRESASANETSGFLPPDTLASSVPSEESKTANQAETAAASGLATREPQLRSAKAARDRAEATLADARTALSRTRISVPFSGLVREESASIGTLVQVGQSLGSVVSTSAYEVRLFLTEDEAAVIPGLLDGSGPAIPATVFYEYGGYTYRWPAVVDRADASLDEATRTIEVFLRVNNPLRGGLLTNADDIEIAAKAPPLLLGAFVDAEIEGTSTESYAEIPASALRPGNEIWVVRDGVLQIVPVRVIQRTDRSAFVTAPGIDEGGQVVVSSLSAPSNDMAVRVAGDTQK